MERKLRIEKQNRITKYYLIAGVIAVTLLIILFTHGQNLINF